MNQKRHGSQENHLSPFGQGKMAGSEYLNKVRNLRHQKLQSDTGKKGSDHQLVGQVIHPEKGGRYISHADGVKELGNSQYGKGIGL